MCRRPVILGGGITMENGGRDESARAVNTPSVSQWVYQRSSIRAGSNVLSNSMMEIVERGPGRQKKQAREPSVAPGPRGVGRRLPGCRRGGLGRRCPAPGPLILRPSSLRGDRLGGRLVNQIELRLEGSGEGAAGRGSAGCDAPGQRAGRPPLAVPP